MREATEKATPRITWLGHAAFEIRTSESVILVDPWLTNPKGVLGPGDVEECDVILVTHNHADHVGDAVEVAVRTEATWPGISEMAGWVADHVGEDRAIPMNIGGEIELPGVAVSVTPAVHSSGDWLARDDQFKYPPVPPTGLVIKSNGITIYHAGDTDVFGDMALIRDLHRPDVAMLPIGGRFTMNPERAAVAVELLEPGLVIPMHYGTIPLLPGTPAQFEEAIASRALDGVKVRVLAPGESVDAIEEHQQS